MEPKWCEFESSRCKRDTASYMAMGQNPVPPVKNRLKWVVIGFDPQPHGNSSPPPKRHAILAVSGIRASDSKATKSIRWDDRPAGAPSRARRVAKKPHASLWYRCPKKRFKRSFLELWKRRLACTYFERAGSSAKSLFTEAGERCDCQLIEAVEPAAQHIQMIRVTAQPEQLSSSQIRCNVCTLQLVLYSSRNS